MLLFKAAIFHLFFSHILSLKDELHVLDPVGLKEDHDDECPQPQDEAARRVPIFRLWFLQNKDNRASLTRGEGLSNG